MPEHERKYFQPEGRAFPGEKKENFENKAGTAVLDEFKEAFLKRGTWAENQFNALIAELMVKRPEDFEEIQVIEGVVKSLLEQRKVDKQRESGRFRYNPETNRNFAEYNYLLGHFFTGLPSGNEKYAATFWGNMESAAKHLGLGKEFNQLRSGIMGQVALYKIMKAVGRNPKFSTPREDVYYSVDMWVPDGEAGAEEALQLKTANVSKDIILQESEWIDFPTVSEVSEEQERHFVTGLNTFSAGIDKYRKEVKKDVSAWFVVLPSGGFDRNTGEPSDILKEDFKKKLGGINKQ